MMQTNKGDNIMTKQEFYTVLETIVWPKVRKAEDFFMGGVGWSYEPYPRIRREFFADAQKEYNVTFECPEWFMTKMKGQY